MAEAIKNMYSRERLAVLAGDIEAVYSPCKAADFLDWILDEAWDGLELKDRMYKISRALGEFLPDDYGEAIAVIDRVVMNYGNWLEGWCGFFPLFVELYGQREEDWDISMAALARYTPYASSEIAVRPFILRHEARMMAQMYEWAGHEDECVRRLASEGCRPALPWAPALPSFKKDPAPVLPILERLKADPSVHVRKSVANNLNDISKTHPDLVAALAKEWYGDNPHTDWVVKHACRTLLKKCNPTALAIFGYGDADAVAVEGFALKADTVPFGGELVFSFAIEAKRETKVRLEYGIDYVKANGKRSRKIFQLSELGLPARGRKAYTRGHSLQERSTRKHYPGPHSVTLVVNGAERGTLDFTLLAPE